MPPFLTPGSPRSGAASTPQPYAAQLLGEELFIFLHFPDKKNLALTTRQPPSLPRRAPPAARSRWGARGRGREDGELPAALPRTQGPVPAARCPLLSSPNHPRAPRWRFGGGRRGAGGHQPAASTCPSHRGRLHALVPTLGSPVLSAVPVSLPGVRWHSHSPRSLVPTPGPQEAPSVGPSPPGRCRSFVPSWL